MVDGLEEPTIGDDASNVTCSMKDTDDDDGGMTICVVDRVRPMEGHTQARCNQWARRLAFGKRQYFFAGGV